MTKKRLLLVRHAKAMLNLRPDLVAGFQPHSPLTDEGVLQATRLGRRLAELGIRPDIVYTSPAERARQTAQHAVPYLSTIDDDSLREMTQGGWEGLPRDEAYVRYIADGTNHEGIDFKTEH